MKRLLRATDKILMILALMGDTALELYIRVHGNGWTRNFASSLDINNAAFRKAISRLLKAHDIERVVNNNKVTIYRLCASGRKKFESNYPLAGLTKKPWDQFWRVAIFDLKGISKKKRDRLRRKLTGLGFGRLREGVYITPLALLADLKEYLKEEGLYGQVVVFEAKEALGFSAKAVANYVWKLESINNRYAELVEEAKELKDTDLIDEEVALKEKLFNVIAKDPFLPKELLPSEWLRDKAKKAILKL